MAPYHTVALYTMERVQSCTIKYILLPINVQLWTAPLKMYRELQRNNIMGPYRAVHIALYVFTHVLQVNVFLVCSDETHSNFTLLHMSGLAVG